MEMQFKTTVIHHLTPIKITSIKKTENNKCLCRCGENGTLVHYWQECKMVQSLRKTVWWVLKKKKLKIELPLHSAILLQGLYPKELKAGS